MTKKMRQKDEHSELIFDFQTGEFVVKSSMGELVESIWEDYKKEDKDGNLKVEPKDEE